MSSFNDQIIELNVNYNCLGEDLVLLESILQTDWKENGFPREFVASSLLRIADYVQQHTEAIDQLVSYLSNPPYGFVTSSPISS